MSEAVYLAHEIEWAHAADRARLTRDLLRRVGGPRYPLTKAEIEAEFDPLAATLLVDLIERRLIRQ